MKCIIAGCPGVYEPRTVAHAVKHRRSPRIVPMNAVSAPLPTTRPA